MPRIAFHTKTTSYLDLKTDIKLARETGYNGIICEHTKVVEYLKKNNQKDLKNFLKDSGVAIFGFANLEVDLLFIDDAVIKELKRYSRLVRSMKGNFVSITPRRDISKTPSDRDSNIRKISENIGILADAAAEYGVNLAIEPKFSDPLVAGPVQITYTIQKCGRDNIGFVFDPFFFHISGVSIEELETIQGDFLVVYMADVPDKKTLNESDREIVGNGILDYEKILRVVNDTHYNGVYAVKLFKEYRTKKRNKRLLRNARDNMRGYLKAMKGVTL